MKKHTNKTFITFLAVPLLMVSLAAAAAIGQTGSEVLTNDDVVTMVKSGLSTIVIVNKIRTSKTSFNLITNELIRLKQSGVNDEILQAMQGTSETPDPPTNTSTPSSTRESGSDVNDPMARHEVGIYLYIEKNGVKNLTEMEPNVSTATRTGGAFGTAVTYGILSTKQLVRVNGREANQQVAEAQPVFYFYLNEKDRSMAAVKYFPASVNQFRLVRFKVKGKNREVTVGQTSVFGTRSGINDDNIVDFSYEKVADGVYRITPRAPMKQGEYGFYLLGTGNAIGATFYDFSIHTP